MNNLNSILLEGELARDPDCRTTSEGVPQCDFAIAVRRTFKVGDAQHTERGVFDVETVARLAEVCGEYLKKGRGVRVVGRLVQAYVPDADGCSRSVVKLHAEHVEFKPQVKTAAREVVGAGTLEE